MEGLILITLYLVLSLACAYTVALYPLRDQSNTMIAIVWVA